MNIDKVIVFHRYGYESKFEAYGTTNVTVYGIVLTI